MAKYQAKPFYLDRINNQILTPTQAKQIGSDKRNNLVYFASKHEYLVYRELTKISNNCIIQLQPKVEVILSKKITCYPKGKTWKADFLMQKNNLPVLTMTITYSDPYKDNKFGKLKGDKRDT